MQFCEILCNFVQFCAILCNFGNFCFFWQFWAILTISGNFCFFFFQIMTSYCLKNENNMFRCLLVKSQIESGSCPFPDNLGKTKRLRLTFSLHVSKKYACFKKSKIEKHNVSYLSQCLLLIAMSLINSLFAFCFSLFTFCFLLFKNCLSFSLGCSFVSTTDLNQHALWHLLLQSFSLSLPKTIDHR